MIQAYMLKHISIFLSLLQQVEVTVVGGGSRQPVIVCSVFIVTLKCNESYSELL